jgi:hypothetical protein
LEDSLWLCPIQAGRKGSPAREGIFKQLSLDDYLLLADYSAHLYRQRKPPVSNNVLEILGHVGYSDQSWRDRCTQLRESRLFGRFSASSLERLRDVAEQLGVHKISNVGGLPKE